MNTTFDTLLERKREKDIPLWQVILEGEIQEFGGSEAAIFTELERRYEIMIKSTEKAKEKPLSTVGNLISGYTKNAVDYAKTGRTICGPFINEVMARALSASEVNASMGRICACPTAGSCGILPAVLVTMEEEWRIPRRRILEALLLASGFGAVVTENATVAGAVGGCQSECGVAAAMAAAAAAYLMDGDDETCISAFSIALMNVMGLVCDPVAGLVQIPCAQRNASQAVNALLSADLALGGMQSPIPPDEMVSAMYSVGKMLPPQLRETAQGGIAATKTGKAIEKQIFG
jgi:L-serine dehydratase